LFESQVANLVMPKPKPPGHHLHSASERLHPSMMSLKSGASGQGRLSLGGSSIRDGNLDVIATDLDGPTGSQTQSRQKNQR
jgi:hypothetical protein